ncbi:hypothetical protein KUG88_24875 [Rhodococcus rhodochrous]|uniref:hypothetical protein n=1 Tax=Rhodococcus rhodochrous TaxID=1829 RepID=UPI001E288B5C|nr:hypothetical protein [Rhodococcus rhodochrous]MCB8913357.1 hypothetical protein [Rhodococcus rhodochrous]
MDTGVRWVLQRRSTAIRSGMDDGPGAEEVPAAELGANRVNHCESVVFGFPQPGQAQGSQLRHSPAGIIEDCRVLVGRFSGEVETWMRASTAIDQLVAHPLAQRALAYSANQSGRKIV